VHVDRGLADDARGRINELGVEGSRVAAGEVGLARNVGFDNRAGAGEAKMIPARNKDVKMVKL